MADAATGEVADTYTLIITDANAARRVHDRMPVILGAHEARRWIEPGPLPGELLVPYAAEEMVTWRVGDEATNSRIEPHAGMAKAVAIEARSPAIDPDRDLPLLSCQSFRTIAGTKMVQAASTNFDADAAREQMLQLAEDSCRRQRLLIEANESRGLVTLARRRLGAMEAVVRRLRAEMALLRND